MRSCPRCGIAYLRNRRASRSVLPPGAKGTIRLIGRLGYLSCAKAEPAASGSADASKVRRVMKFMRISLEAWSSRGRAVLALQVAMQRQQPVGIEQRVDAVV